MKLQGPVCLLRRSSLLSDYTGGSSLLVEDEVEHLYIVFEDWRSSVHAHQERALLNLLKIKSKTSQEVKELARKKLSSLTKSNLEWALFLFQRIW